LFSLDNLHNMIALPVGIGKEFIIEILNLFQQNTKMYSSESQVTPAESISAWSNQGSVMCLLSILNQ